MKNAVKNNFWEKTKGKIQFVWDWIHEKVNNLLGKVGLNFQGIIALGLLILAGIAAIFITLGIISILIFFIVFYIIFVAISSIVYSIFYKNKK